MNHHALYYHYAFMMDGKRYRGVCKSCTTQRAAEAHEAKLRETVYEAAKSKTVKDLVETFRNELTGGRRVALAAAFDLYLKKPTKRVAGTLQTARNRSYWNDFRHTFAYLAGVYNIPQTIVQSVLGHMTPEMTALYQQHAQREEKERFFRQMPNVLGIAVHSDNAVNVTSAEVPLLPSVSPAREALKQLIDTLPDEKVRELLDRLESGRLF